MVLILPLITRIEPLIGFFKPSSKTNAIHKTYGSACLSFQRIFIVYFYSAVLPPGFTLRILQANRYEDVSLKGLVPIDEIPLCNCDVDVGCDADCIK